MMASLEKLVSMEYFISDFSMLFSSSGAVAFRVEIS